MPAGNTLQTSLLLMVQLAIPSDSEPSLTILFEPYKAYERRLFLDYYALFWGMFCVGVVPANRIAVDD
jgi:hypothetical protein